jgi:hypothetical protein
VPGEGGFEEVPGGRHSRCKGPEAGRSSGRGGGGVGKRKTEGDRAFMQGLPGQDKTKRGCFEGE